MHWASAPTCLLLLSLAACDQKHAPVDQVAETAGKIVAPNTAAPAPLARGPYAPRDTCGSVEGAEDFRSTLAEVVKARDVDGLVALAASDVKLDFGGGSGAEELRNRLQDDDRDLWNELDELLRLGCAANAQGGITIPWYFEQNINTVEWTSGMLVTGEDVPLLAAPDADARQLGAVSWDVVKIAEFTPDAEYQRVELPGRTEEPKAGFIASDKLRSLVDYRLIASRRNNRWSITSFVAGDWSLPLAGHREAGSVRSA